MDSSPALTCSRCGAHRAEGARFCGACGQRFEDAPPSGQVPLPGLPASRPAPAAGPAPRPLPATEPGLPVAVEPVAVAAPSLGPSTLPGAAGLPSQPALPGGPDPLVGSVIDGRYLVKDRLGSGGMGTVYRVVHERMQKTMALKILNPSVSADPVVRQRFRREARAASLLESRNTVAVFDFGETPAGLLYLVMEFLRGRTLAAELARVRRLTPLRVVRILSQVLRSLEEAHAQGIVHRDVKPDNIFLVEGEDADFVKVLDFGIAKGERLVDAEKQGPTTRSDLVVGTPEYMAPEQARGQGVDGRADLWAVGVILYEALVGRLPFSGPTPVEVLVALMERPVPLPWDVAPDANVPPALWRVMERGLQKRPENRFASAVQMREALQAAAAELSSGTPAGISAPPRAPLSLEEDDFDVAGRDEWESFARSQARRRSVLIGMLVAVALGLGAGVGTLLSVGHPVAVEQEPNQDVMSANLVAPASSVRGVLAVPQDGKADQDMFVMELPPGPQVLTAEVVPALAAPVELGLTAWVVPPGSADARLVFAGRGKTAARPRIPNLTVEGGRLYLRVREELREPGMPPSPQEIPYRLNLFALRPLAPGEEREGNNSRDTAGSLGNDGMVTGLLAPAEDEDWFKVPLPDSDVEVTAEVSPVAELAVDVSFYDSDGRRALHKAGKPGERVSIKITPRRCGSPCFVEVEAAARPTVADPAYRLLVR